MRKAELIVLYLKFSDPINSSTCALEDSLSLSIYTPPTARYNVEFYT